MSCGVTTLIEYAAFFGSIQIFKYLVKNGVELYPSLWNFAIHGNNPELISFLEDSGLRFYTKSMFEKNSDYDSYESDTEKDEKDNDNESDTEKVENGTEKVKKDTEKVKKDTKKVENDNSSEKMVEEEEDSDEIYDEDFDDNENQKEDEISDFNNSREKLLKEAIKCHHNDMANYIISNCIKKNKIEYYIDHNFGKSVDAYSFKFYNYYFLPKNFNHKFIIFYAAEYGYYEIVNNLLKNTKLKLMMRIIL